MCCSLSFKSDAAQNLQPLVQDHAPLYACPHHVHTPDPMDVTVTAKGTADYVQGPSLSRWR